MRRRKAIRLLSLWVLAGLACFVGWLVYQQEQQERLNRDLIAAIKRKDVPTGLAALYAGADPNSRDDSSQPPSFWQSLRRLFSGMWRQDKLKGNILTKRLIAQPGDTVTVIRGYIFVNGKLVHQFPLRGLSALMLALDSGEVETDEYALMTPLSQALIAKGASINIRDEDGDTPLMFAAAYESASTVRALLDKGAEINAKNRHGYTALMQAALSGHADIVKILLAQGADVNIRDADGDTALSGANAGGDIATNRLLKQAGAKR